MPVDYRAHGRRHAADAEDPIPGLGAAASMWPMNYNLMLPGDLNNVAGLSAADWVETADYGTSQFSDFHWSNTSGGATDGDYLTRIVRLGPQGSIWNVWYVSDMGTDFGKIKFQLASISEDADAAVSGFDNVTGGLQATDTEGDSVTFYDLKATSGGTTHDDHYAAGPSTAVSWDALWQFRLMGADGTALTATPTLSADASAPVYECNGGAGLYALRLLVDGKNASSSGYRVRLRAFRLYRNTWALLTT